MKSSGLSVCFAPLSPRDETNVDGVHPVKAHAQKLLHTALSTPIHTRDFFSGNVFLSSLSKFLHFGAQIIFIIVCAMSQQKICGSDSNNNDPLDLGLLLTTTTATTRTTPTTACLTWLANEQSKRAMLDGTKWNSHFRV